MHTWAFVAALPAGLLLTSSAQDATARLASGIYATTLVLLFGTSAAYHRITRTERSRTIMQRLDHSMIYLLIVGTYTPLCLVAMPRRLGLPFLCVQAALAILGIGLTNFAFDQARRLAYAVYPAMVLIAAGAGPSLVTHATGAQLSLLIAGIIAYAVGVPVLMHKRPNPFPVYFGYHEIWHVMTILAAAMHFVAIRDIVT